jgi:hypothetical protein
MSNFNQGVPGPALINSSNVFIFGNTSSGNALSVQQLGAGNVVSFSNASGGSNVFVMNNLGRVGVGTASPTHVNSSGTLLHVYDATVNTPTIRIDSTGGTGQARLHMSAGNGANYRATRLDFFNFPTSTTVPTFILINDYDQNGTNNFDFVNSAGTRMMSLKQNGNVGIGTASPAELLHVYGGNIRLGSTGTASVFNSYTGSDFGNLSLISGYQAASSAPRINIVGYTGAGTVNGDNIIQLATNGSTRMTINQSGNVGIGTTSPTSTLDLAGGQLTSRYITSPGGNYLTIQNGAGGSQIGLQGTTTAITGGTVYMTGGNVGIGTTTPSGKLTVATSGGGTSAAGYWDANWSVVHGTTVGGAGGGVGIAFNDGNYGLLSCVTPSIGWRTMLYGAGRHDFYLNGTFALAMYNIMTGGATTISVDAGGGLQRGAVSDRRLKSNIVTMTDFGLKTITDLRPVTYEATPESLKRIGAGVHIGLVAQEVQTIFPYAVSADQDEQKTLTIDYIKLVPVMINAIKELSAENTALKTQMSSLEQRLAALESKLAA